MVNRIQLKTLVVLIPLLIAAFFTGCKRDKFTLPQIPGNWTLLNNPPGTGLFTTGTGFISFTPASTFALFDPGLQLTPNLTATAAWYSGDHGGSWTPILNFSSSNMVTLYVDLINKSNVVGYSSNDSTFYISHNGGQTWGVLNHLSYNLNVSVPSYFVDSGQISADSAYYATTFYGVSNNRLFAQRYAPFTPNGAMLYLLKSDNLGNTWDTVLTNFYETSQPIELLSIGSAIFQFTYGQNLRSYNNGSNWSVINPASQVTFWGGALSNGDVVGLDAYNNTIYLSHDSGATWISEFHNVYGSLAPVLAFDSVIVLAGYYPDAWHILCANPKKMNWYAADGGIGGNNYIGIYSSIYVDSAYVYADFYTDALYTSGFYRRPRSDFRGL